MQLPQLRTEIETRRLRIGLQRKEIRALERAGISTVSANDLLTRMPLRSMNCVPNVTARWVNVASPNAHKQTTEGSFPYWVAINADLRMGANFQRHQDFCCNRNLEISKRYSPSVVWQREWYVILRFAKEEHAEIFIKEFGSERMHPSEKGRGKNWAR